MRWDVVSAWRVIEGWARIPWVATVCRKRNISNRVHGVILLVVKTLAGAVRRDYSVEVELEVIERERSVYQAIDVH